MTSGEVSMVLAGHVEWDQGSKQRVVTWLVQDLEQLVPPGQDEERRNATLSQVISFITQGIQPSRRERAGLSLKVLKILKKMGKTENA